MLENNIFHAKCDMPALHCRCSMEILADNLIAKLWNQITMATFSKILEGDSYNSMITTDSHIIRGRKNSIIAANNKNIIAHSKWQECAICVF